MQYALKPLTAALALILALFAATIFAAPAALAQGSGQFAGDTVAVTFELEVNGGVPGWQFFHVEHGGGSAGEMPLCTTHTEKPGPMCETGGVYTASMEVPAGKPVNFEFVRDGDPGPSETFASESRSFAQDTTVHASYDFPEVGPPEPAGPSGNAGDQYTGAEDQYAAEDAGAVEAEDGSEDLPPVLPDTGGLPLVLLGAILISAGAGLALLSRRLL